MGCSSQLQDETNCPEKAGFSKELLVFGPNEVNNCR